MTTKVTVDAHAGWPVHVEIIDKDNDNGEWKTTRNEVVPAMERRDFYVTSSRRLTVSEGSRD